MRPRLGLRWDGDGIPRRILCLALRRDGFIDEDSKKGAGGRFPVHLRLEGVRFGCVC